MTLANKETNLILTDKGNRATQGNLAMKMNQPGEQLWTIQDNVAMPVTNPGDQFENICKWSNGQY